MSSLFSRSRSYKGYAKLDHDQSRFSDSKSKTTFFRKRIDEETKERSSVTTTSDYEKDDQSRFSDSKSKTKFSRRRVDEETRKTSSVATTTSDYEKDFVSKVGGMTWESFQEAKKYGHISDNIIKWDDEAAKEAIIAARIRFWAEFTGFSGGCDLPPLNPDLYIDNIDWNDDTQVIDDQNDPVLSLSDTEEADYVRRCQVVNGKKVLVPESFFVPIDQVVATGWDD